MNLRHNMSHGDIDDLVTTSKQLQNKLRKELRLQTIEPSFASRGDRQEIPPIWDSFRHNPYVKNVVADFLVEDTNFICKSGKSEDQTDVKKPIKQNKFQCNHSMQRTQTQTQVPFDIQSRDAEVIPQKIFTTIGTQVSQNELQEPLMKKNISKTSGITFPPKKPLKVQRSMSNSGCPEVSKNRHESCFDTMKPSSSILRLSWQRFAGTSKRNINFSEEHPNLELDNSFNQTTLFPRRMRKDTKSSNSVKVSKAKGAINLATAKAKPPGAVPVAIPGETWKEVLLKNCNQEKSNKCMEVDSHKTPKLEIKKPKDIDIILKPPNGLFHLEKQNGRISKQKKCDFQHFPVMYIRPECQVQRVANISIRGDSEENTAMENYPANVKYVTCKHEEEKTDVGSSVPKVEKSVTNDNRNIRNEENKFFKALECIKLSKTSPISRDSFSSLPKSSPKMRSRTSSIYSGFSSKAQNSNSPPSVDRSDNDVHHIIEEMLPQIDGLHPSTTKNFIINPPTQREVYVQTDYKEIAATKAPLLPAPLPPPSELTTSITFRTHHHPNAGCRPTTKQEDDNYSEDDFITKIFARIRNDMPNAVEAFKGRSTTAHEAMPLESFTIQKHQEQKQSFQHQKSAIGNASNVDLLPNEIEPGLVPIEAKRHDSSHTILQMAPPDDTAVNLHSPPAGGADQKFLLLQQNPLFVQTVNRIKSSAMRDGRIKEDRHKYPTDAEIKRAVKIFLDSLTLDDGAGGGRKSIIKGDGVRKKLTPWRSELTSSRRITKYSSSISTNTSNSSGGSSKKSRVNSTSNVRDCDMFISSTSTLTYTTDSETDIDICTGASHLPAAQMTATSHSEGEVLSIGEI